MTGRVLNRIELLQGTLDLIVLQTLLQGPRHGYGIAQMIRASSKDVLQVETGSLYPALHRLEQRGLVEVEIAVQEGRPPRKYYQLTPAGETALAEAEAEWNSMTAAMGDILDGCRRLARGVSRDAPQRPALPRHGARRRFAG